MAELIDVVNAIFKNRNNWVNITDSEKEKNFFIINRYFCKIYPDKSQLLNSKNIDKVMAMDTWYYFMKTQPYPENFWSKSPKIDKEISDKDYKLLLRSLKVKDIDLDYLIDRYPDFIKEELAYLKKLEKEFKNK
jgi:hypothetical protein